MRCQSGRHEWTDEMDAMRCCTPLWRRAMRFRGQEDDLDSMGRVEIPIDGVVMICGWVQTDLGRAVGALPIPGGA